MREEDIERQRCGGVSDSGGRTSGTAVLFGVVLTYALLRNQALSPAAHVRRAISHLQCTTWSLLSLLPSGADKANETKGRGP